MPVFPVLLLLFFTVPLFEIYLLLQVGSRLGVIPTVALVVLTAVMGAFLLRLQGISTWLRVQQSLEGGRLPAREMLDAAALLVAGVLLLTPGFFTDALGFALLIPGIRVFLYHCLFRRQIYSMRPAQTKEAERRKVIDGDFDREDD